MVSVEPFLDAQVVGLMHEIKLLLLHLVVDIFTIRESKDTFIVLPKEPHKGKKTLVHESDARGISP